MSEITQLGRQMPLPATPEDAVIEAISVGSSLDRRVCARFTIPEFTSLCPVTGQPDFARIIIDYIPDQSLIESKSLKLYLASFRNHGAFHEQVISDIGERLLASVDPIWIRVVGLFYPRGGIPIDVFWESDDPPDGGFIIPPLETSPYVGR